MFQRPAHLVQSQPDQPEIRLARVDGPGRDQLEVPRDAVADASRVVERDLTGHRAVGWTRSASGVTEWSGWLPPGLPGEAR